MPERLCLCVANEKKYPPLRKCGPREAVNRAHESAACIDTCTHYVADLAEGTHSLRIGVYCGTVIEGTDAGSPSCGHCAFVSRVPAAAWQPAAGTTSKGLVIPFCSF